MEKLLSLCMIVKNEEKVLRRCLESVKDLVDEIIIIDSGSTDTTKEIALEYTDHIYDYEWTNDFAAARNEGIRRATGKWILILDADEYIQNEQHQELKDILRKHSHSPEAIGITFSILNYLGATEAESTGFMESHSIRIFLNGRGLLYKGAIHEQIVSPTGAFETYSHSFYIYHIGYTDQINQEKDKATRNITIFNELKKRNQLKTPYDDFTLANEYAKLRDLPKALYSYEKAYRRCKDKNNYWIPHCADRLITVYKILKKYKEAFQLTEECLERWSEYPDFHTIKGMLLDVFGFEKACQNKMEQSIRIAENLESQNEQYWKIHLDHGKFLPYQKLAEIYYKQRNLNKTVFALTKVLNIDRNQFQALYKLAHLLSLQEADKDTIAFFEKLYSSSKASNCLLLFQTFLLLGKGTLTQHYYNLCIEHKLLLSEADILRYYLLLNEPTSFQNKVLEMNFGIASDEACKLLLLAALTWQDPAYLIPLADLPEERARLYNLGQAIFGSQNEDILDHEDLLYTILIDLFTVQSYEAYDLLINQYVKPSLLNKLAHYFYNQNYIEMAINYYSILIENHEMEAMGYYNLSLVHLYEGKPQEGLHFLKQAIEIEPGHLPFYATWLEHCTDPELNAKYREKFNNLVPSCRHINFA
ncbi:TPR repeat-containing protein [Paenibacillus tianmuensis]|uniref:TPR repeat-containing protein n=1 Tax=Paenibacillus tianmuensis TaxID=624147 RepID=A0A1G4RP66_9BACL|nr:glycosyltransferase family 2 protein [Paenibacillus tianmuensis]SCW58618.1 TPR repeat-containing protein [Paenibacillus tianmuensis]